MENKAGRLGVSLRIRLMDGEKVLFGPGVADLLRKTDELGSLLAAAKDMGMSYRKALRIVKTAEARLGRVFLDKAIGGAGGGGSKLTGFAREFLTSFTELEREALAFIQEKAGRLLPAAGQGPDPTPSGARAPAK